MSGTDIAELLGIIALIGMTGFFAMSETCITRTNRARAYRLVEEKRRGAASLMRIVDNVAPYLNVVLLLTLLCTIGGTTLATILAARHLHRFAELVSTVGMTILLFIFAEVTPKTWAVQQTDKWALRVAPVLVTLNRAIGPVAYALVKVANLVMPGRGLPEGPLATEEEIRAMAEVASEEESIEEQEKELIHSIFEFGDTLVREVMVPRPDIVAAPVDSDLRTILDLLLKHGYSRIPVYRADMDNMEGVVYAKDVLRHLHAGREDVPIDKIMREPLFVPESKRVSELLREMQLRRIHIAVVLDEYG